MLDIFSTGRLLMKVHRVNVTEMNHFVEVGRSAAIVISLNFKRVPVHNRLTNDVDDSSFARGGFEALAQVLAIVSGVWDEDGEMSALVCGRAGLG